MASRSKHLVFISSIDQLICYLLYSSYLSRWQNKMLIIIENRFAIKLINVFYFIYAIYSFTIQDFEERK